MCDVYPHPEDIDEKKSVYGKLNRREHAELKQVLW